MVCVRYSRGTPGLFVPLKLVRLRVEEQERSHHLVCRSKDQIESIHKVSRLGLVPELRYRPALQVAFIYITWLFFNNVYKTNL